MGINNNNIDIDYDNDSKNPYINSNNIKINNFHNKNEEILKKNFQNSIDLIEMEINQQKITLMINIQNKLNKKVKKI